MAHSPRTNRTIGRPTRSGEYVDRDRPDGIRGIDCIRSVERTLYRVLNELEDLTPRSPNRTEGVILDPEDPTGIEYPTGIEASPDGDGNV